MGEQAPRLGKRSASRGSPPQATVARHGPRVRVTKESVVTPAWGGRSPSGRVRDGVRGSLRGQSGRSCPWSHPGSRATKTLRETKLAELGLADEAGPPREGVGLLGAPLSVSSIGEAADREHSLPRPGALPGQPGLPGASVYGRHGPRAAAGAAGGAHLPGAAGGVASTGRCRGGRVYRGAAGGAASTGRCREGASTGRWRGRARLPGRCSGRAATPARSHHDSSIHAATEREREQRKARTRITHRLVPGSACRKDGARGCAARSRSRAHLCLPAARRPTSASWPRT